MTTGAQRGLQPAPALEKWLTCQQVADALGYRLSTVVNDWKRHADLSRAARKRGRLLRFNADAIAEIQQKARVLSAPVERAGALSPSPIHKPSAGASL